MAKILILKTSGLNKKFPQKITINKTKTIRIFETKNLDKRESSNSIDLTPNLASNTEVMRKINWFNSDLGSELINNRGNKAKQDSKAAKIFFLILIEDDEKTYNTAQTA